MKNYLAAYLATAFVMLAIDMLWLGVIAKTLYQQAIGHLMAEQPRLPAALVFYVLYPLGVLIFAVLPGSEDAAWQRTVVMGALFGFFAYATYDLSNLATLKSWPVHLTIIDIAWGSAITAVSAVAGKAAWTLATNA